MSAPSIAIIILAAGNSSRMGQPKQLLNLKGKTLLQTTIDAAQGTGNPVILVLGHEAEEHARAVVNFRGEIVLNPSWELGMGNSIKAGLGYVLDRYPEVAGVIVCVCDQPLLTTQHLNDMVQAFERDHRTTASAYADVEGVPVLFARKDFEQVVKVDDKQGAKKVLEQVPHTTLPFPDGSIDLDTRADYEEFLKGMQ